MRVLITAAELAPVTNVGGLGEAVAGLVHELRATGVHVDVVIPDHAPGRVALAGEVRRRIAVPSWAAPASVRVGEHAIAGRLHLVTVPGIERSHPYLRPDGTGWPDNDARFLAFSRAVGALVRAAPPDVLHLHDWHTAAVLAALSQPPPSVLTLHNVAYQGVTGGAWLRRLGPRSRHYEWWGGTNPLSGGIALADGLVAVSPHHAAEIRTPGGGFGLDGPLRQRGDALIGIRNGIDTQRWDPATDAWLAARYDVTSRSLPAARAQDRRDVLARFGWPDDATPLAVMVTRLTDQKGVDLMLPVVPVLRHVPMRLVVLGIGDAGLARALAGLSADHPGSLAFVEAFDEALAHRLFAGGDVFVMPSRFEPGGLAAMQAMRYGAIPVVTPVGGLVDSVPDVDAAAEGRGFVADGVSSVGVVSALFRAARLVADRRRRAPLVRQIMALDWSWRDPAARYIEEYGRVRDLHAGRAGRE
jgi:starch synthase